MGAQTVQLDPNQRSMESRDFEAGLRRKIVGQYRPVTTIFGSRSDGGNTMPIAVNAWRSERSRPTNGKRHCDGIVAVTCKVLPGDNVALATAQPARFYLPAYIGPRGWVALRLDVGDVDWDEVGELVAGSYRLVAPKRLAALVKARLI